VPETRWRAGAGAVARAGDVEARANDDSEHPSRKVTLEIRGERDTRFSGTCSIGGGDRRIGGRVPESYSYELGGKKLECEIRKDGPGTLDRYSYVLPGMRDQTAAAMEVALS
jgi:hypothetical protein